MDKLSTLWQAAGYQDNLLQAYRKFNIAIQALLIIAASGFVIATIAFGSSIEGWITYSILVVLSGAGIYLLITLNKLIKSRSADVNYFQNQIIEFEKSLPRNEQVLTAFKVYQKFGRDNANTDEHFSNFILDDTLRIQLIEKGKGHTRKILDDYLFWIFLMIWFSFHLVVLLVLILP